MIIDFLENKFDKIGLMKKEIIINAAINEVRVAITEDGKLGEFFIELPEKVRYIGNVYYGRVNKVASGLNAAFIDIGLNQDAFLHFSDVDDAMENTLIIEEDDDDDIQVQQNEQIDAEANKGNKKQKNNRSKNNKKAIGEGSAMAQRKEKYQSLLLNSNSKLAKFHTKRSGDITINLEAGQNVLVQVIREAYHSKGMKVTTKIAIPGRYTVLLPFDNMLGVSRKVPSYVERKRLRQLAKATLPDGFGGIIRTAAQGKSEDELRRDWDYLIETWKNVEEKVSKMNKPGLVYQDLGLATSIVRDLFNSDVARLSVDSKKLYREIATYLKANSPHILEKVNLHQGDVPIFEAFGIEKELMKTYRRTVSLPSGGDIVIDQTEALTVIDVNSGRSKEEEQEKNALKTNLEAALEIARQIRLRDIAGIIVCDFIDLHQEQNRRKLLNEMKNFLSRDRAKTVAYPLTQLGLMQITRQRINQNIEEKTSDVCQVCQGTGRIISKAVLINSIERWLKNFRKKTREFKVILQVHPQIATYLTEGTISIASKLMLKYFVKLTVQQNDSVPIDKFKFFSVRKEKEITNEFL